MKNAGFILEPVTAHDGSKEKRIKMHTTEDTEYVTFYMNDRLIPIPYDCLVCFVANNIKMPKDVSPNVAALEKIIISIQNVL